MTFVGKPIVPEGVPLDDGTLSRGEPSLPRAFRFEDRLLTVRSVVKQWRSTKSDRGDSYLKRHWFEFVTDDGGTAVVYFDRAARLGQARWYLYTLGY